MTVEGTRTKNRRTAVLPLRQDVAAELREWLRDKPAGAFVFPIAGRKRKAMLRADLKAAGIEPVVDGKVIDIHALRVSFITHLSLGGVPLAVRCPEAGSALRPQAHVERVHEPGDGRVAQGGRDPAPGQRCTSRRGASG